MADDGPVLNDVTGFLLCPVCGDDLTAVTAPAPGTLRCRAGHSFDIARHGYANLLAGGSRATTADTADMVRARQAFLSAGHFAPLIGTLAGRVREVTGGSGCVLDAGAGTGHHLAAVLGRSPGQLGIALDLSKHAARRAAAAHPRIGAVVCDLWRPLPVRDRSMAAVMNVFAPRNGPEFARVLGPEGALIVVAPTGRHLSGLIGPLGLLSVDARKEERIGETLGDHFTLEFRETCDMDLALGHEDVRTLVGMGPSARHIEVADLSARVAALPDQVTVEASFTVSVFRRSR